MNSQPNLQNLNIAIFKRIHEVTKYNLATSHE